MKKHKEIKNKARAIDLIVLPLTIIIVVIAFILLGLSSIASQLGGKWTNEIILMIYGGRK
jgi:hypothetical protein